MLPQRLSSVSVLDSESHDSHSHLCSGSITKVANSKNRKELCCWISRTYDASKLHHDSEISKLRPQFFSRIHPKGLLKKFSNAISGPIFTLCCTSSLCTSSLLNVVQVFCFNVTSKNASFL